MQSFYCTKEWSYDHLGNGLKALDWKRALNRIYYIYLFYSIAKKGFKKKYCKKIIKKVRPLS